MTPQPDACFAVVSQTAATRREPQGIAGHRHAAPPTALPLVKGYFMRWWQVLGSNQRRLSRRFTDHDRCDWRIEGYLGKRTRPGCGIRACPTYIPRPGASGIV